MKTLDQARGPQVSARCPLARQASGAVGSGSTAGSSQCGSAQCPFWSSVLAGSMMVLVAAQKSGGEPVLPTGKANGQATSWGVPVAFGRASSKSGT